MSPDNVVCYAVHPQLSAEFAASELGMVTDCRNSVMGAGRWATAWPALGAFEKGVDCQLSSHGLHVIVTRGGK